MSCVGEVVIFSFPPSRPVFILKARSWSYTGEDNEIKSPLGFKNLKIVAFGLLGNMLYPALAKQASHKVRINAVLLFLRTG